MLNYQFCMYKDDFSIEELKHLFDTIDYDMVEDRYLVDNPELYCYIHWDRISKMQAIRMAARNLDILNRIDFKKYDYKIREIFFLIKRNYNILFEHFNFDFNNLSRDDAYFLLCIGSQEFYDMIDIKKYDFSFIEMINIIRAYNYNRKIIVDLNYHELKNYQITEILIVTGEENADLFNLDSLSTLNWLDLLMYQPNFLGKCDFDKFIKGDPFNLVQLIVLFDKPDLSYLLNNINLDNITPFGWEKLLIAKPEQFERLCNFSKLNESNWIVIGAYSPELLKYKQS